MSTLTQSTASWQTSFLQIMPAVETHAQIQFRHLPAADRTEKIQESIAAACLAYQRLAVRGRLHFASPSIIATFAVKHARSGRHLGSHQDGPRDVMSPICQRRHGFQVGHYADRKLGDGAEAWRQITLADRRIPVPDLAAFKIDFADWLRTQTDRHRRIIAAMATGERTWAIAEKFGLSEGRVSQLRRRYEMDWNAFQRQAA